ncbi:MAG: radical SAM protein [Phycisphaerae bacterium]
MDDHHASKAFLPQHHHHPRAWRENLYVYPVISRRSGGLSIGINLNPDKACNFDCIYCQVDRTQPSRVRDVDLEILHRELSEMIRLGQSKELFADPLFRNVPSAMQAVQDLAFSGDGEPTTCKLFPAAVELAADLKRAAAMNQTKMVLITDACYLTKPDVAGALRVLDENQGEIWAKLDAGTEAYLRRVNLPNVTLGHVVKDIIETARVRPLVIQSLFMCIDGAPPSGDEVAAYVSRLREVLDQGGRIDHVQVYTVARKPAEANVTPLTDGQVDAIADRVTRETGLRAERYYG